jgi:DNA-binding CsgD family transcriptional regulator
VTTAQPRTGRPSPWLLPDDGVIDPIAIDLTVRGARRVPLTRTERRLVAAVILAGGGTAYQIATRLHVSTTTARRYVRDLTGPAAPTGTTKGHAA